MRIYRVNFHVDDDELEHYDETVHAENANDAWDKAVAQAQRRESWRYPSYWRRATEDSCEVVVTPADVWIALKNRLAGDPARAKRLVMVSEADVIAACKDAGLSQV